MRPGTQPTAHATLSAPLPGATSRALTRDEEQREHDGGGDRLLGLGLCLGLVRPLALLLLPARGSAGRWVTDAFGAARLSSLVAQQGP